jgi:hypothetical protein
MICTGSELVCECAEYRCDDASLFRVSTTEEAAPEFIVGEKPLSEALRNRRLATPGMTVKPKDGPCFRIANPLS